MKSITFLDAYTSNSGDFSWDMFEKLGRFTVYDRTSKAEIVPRAKKVQYLIVNKVPIDENTLDELEKLEAIFVCATGYNNVDIEAAAKRGMPVSNVGGYGTPSVAQHVFALILALVNRVAHYHKRVREGAWLKAGDFTFREHTCMELAGKTMGIYGLGRIGRKVAAIALAFDMKVIAHHKHPERDKMPGVEFVDFNTLLRRSDVLSLHAPLTDSNAGIINALHLSLMKPTALLINTGRGGMVVEEDLRRALENGVIAGAGLDVLSVEPPPNDHPLLQAPNCLVTPHQAWGTVESRKRLVEGVAENIMAMLRGELRNVVNGVTV